MQDFLHRITYYHAEGYLCPFELKEGLSNEQTYQRSNMIAGFAWNGFDVGGRTGPPQRERRHVNRDENEHEDEFEGPEPETVKSYGYTVNDFTYDTDDAHISEIPDGSPEEQETWLQANGFHAVEIADSVEHFTAI